MKGIRLRRVIVLVIVFFILICGLCGYLIVANFGLRNALKEVNNLKEAEYKKRIIAEKEFIKKELEEKYRADLVSFEAMHKRLEIEKQKNRELTEELKNRKTEKLKN